MVKVPEWWQKPRNISVIVDNPSWILPQAASFVKKARDRGDNAVLCTAYENILGEGIAFFWGCVSVVSSDILKRNHRNLVIHESDLPRGKGFAPMTWQILEGNNEIVVSLIDAVDSVDAGNIIDQKTLYFDGHELCNEIREAQGRVTEELCESFLSKKYPVEGRPQSGEATFYRRRYPNDSEMDVNRSIADQFELLRVVDNERYPAFFKIRGFTYIIKIEKK